MAHVKRSVEVDAPVDAIHEEWQQFENLPRCVAHSLHADVRWRAEVLTLEPIPTGTRITLKIEFDPGGCEAALPCRLDTVLRTFTSFFEARRGRQQLVAQSA